MHSKSLVWFGLILSLASMTGCVGISVGGSSSGGGLALTKIDVEPKGIGLAVGLTQPYKATGTFNDGTSHDITAKVTWSSSAPNLVSIDSSGVATALAPGQATITATSSTSITGSASLTVNPAALQSITVTPTGPGLAANQTQQFAATGNFTDGTTQDMTQTATWSPSDATVATISSSGLATALAAGQTAITATSGAVSGFTALNVVCDRCSSPTLNGNYAFTIISTDARGPAYFVGSFHADGAGNIDSGTMDANTQAGFSANVPLTGLYTVFADGRGDLVLSPTGFPATTYRFVLTSNAQRGQFIQFSGTGSAAGSFDLQTDSDFNVAALSGNYIFRFNGIDTGSNPIGALGLFTTDGAGNITGGEEDVNDFGSYSGIADSLLPTSFSSISANGRGTFSLTTASGTSSFVFYVVSAAKVNFLATSSLPAVAGVALQQFNQTYSDADLQGGYGYLLQRAPGGGRETFNTIGRTAYDGLGSVTGGLQDEVSGALLNAITGGTYAVGSDGRGSISETTDNGPRSYVCYMVSPKRALLMDTTSSAGAGQADLEDGVVDDATLEGTYGFAGADIGGSGAGVSMFLLADGGGNIVGVGDVWEGEQPSTVLASANYSVTPSGRTTVTLNNNPVGAQAYIFYVVSSVETLMLGVEPAVNGIGLLQ